MCDFPVVIAIHKDDNVITKQHIDLSLYTCIHVEVECKDHFTFSSCICVRTVNSNVIILISVFYQQFSFSQLWVALALGRHTGIKQCISSRSS